MKIAKKIYSSCFLVSLSMLLAMVFSSCSNSDKLPPLPEQSKMAAIPTPTPEEIKEKPVYVYAGDRYRDPFMTAGASTSYQPESIFDPQRATLKGIIYGNRYRSAVINVTGGGVYFIKGEQIFDVMGKVTQGYTAKVFLNRVVIRGEADTEYELKIKNEDEEVKKS